MCFAVFVILGFLAVTTAQDTHDVKVLNTTHTWIEARTQCSAQNPAMAMLSNYTMVKKGLNEYLMNLSNLEPFWIYGLQLTPIKASLKLWTNTASENEMFYHICNGPTVDLGTQQPYGTQNCTLQIVEMKTIDRLFKWPTYYQAGKELWVDRIRTTDMVEKSNTDLTVQCLLVDRDGKVKVDNCSNQHRVVCIDGTFKDMVYYVNISEPYPEQYLPPVPTTTAASTLAPSFTTGTTDDGTISSTQSRASNTTLQGDITTTSLSTVAPPSDQTMPDEVMYAIIGVSAIVVIVILCAIGCCCISRGKKRKPTQTVQLAEVYSDAFDSIALKEPERSPNDAEKVEYATPEDALPRRKIIPRQSIGENEYDSIEATKKTQKQFPNTGHVYSHVAINKDKKPELSNSSEPENVYDVTSHSKWQTSERGTPDGGSEQNVYEHLKP